MTSEIDAYYALRPSAYSDLVSLCVEPSAIQEPYGLTVKLVLADPADSEQTITLRFVGVSELNVEHFSGPSVSMIDISSTRERGWESPRFLISSDQGRIRFGCMTFEANVAKASAGDIPER
jgi:hypothetical protein